MISEFAAFKLQVSPRGHIQDFTRNLKMWLTSASEGKVKEEEEEEEEEKEKEEEEEEEEVPHRVAPNKIEFQWPQSTPKSQ